MCYSIICYTCLLYEFLCEGITYVRRGLTPGVLSIGFRLATLNSNVIM